MIRKLKKDWFIIGVAIIFVALSAVGASRWPASEVRICATAGGRIFIMVFCGLLGLLPGLFVGALLKGLAGLISDTWNTEGKAILCWIALAILGGWVGAHLMPHTQVANLLDLIPRAHTGGSIYVTPSHSIGASDWGPIPGIALGAVLGFVLALFLVGPLVQRIFSPKQ